jgi:integrase
VYLGRDSEGKRRYVNKTVRGTGKEARQALTQMQRETDTGTLAAPTKHTLKSFLETWLKTKVDVRARTLHDYAVRLKADVIPELGSVRLSDVTPLTVNTLYAKLMQERGYSPRTVRYTHSVLHHALEQAVTWGFLVRNPTTHATLPRQTRRPPNVLGAEQIAKLLRETTNDTLHALWTLLLTTGLRPGEALALKWSDVVNKAVAVRRTLCGNGKGSYTVVEAEAKTRGSIRTVTLPQTTLDALEVHRRRQAESVLRTGERYERRDFIFASTVGSPLDPAYVRRQWSATVKRLGLPRVRLYDTRHSHATALLTRGVNLAWVSERLGHSDIKLTKDVYAHVLPEAHREMAEVMEQIVTAKVATA